jgi:hypothetical protein
MKSVVAAFVLLVIIATWPFPARASFVTISAAKDNTMYAENDSLSNGAGQRFFAGKNGSGDVRRGLIKFNLTGRLPGSATVDSVVLRLNLAQAQPGSRVVRLHRLLADWGEGASAAVGGEGGGAPASANDATWLQRFFGGGPLWTTPGGDYDPTVSASRPVGAVLGPYTWRGAGMIADVNFWMANPSQNHGWELVGDEGGPAGTAKAFSTRQASIETGRPTLTIHYTIPVPAGPVPAVTRLLPVQPNPFNPAATIRYQLAEAGRVVLDVHDASGRLVRVLVDGNAPAGLHETVWHGDDVRDGRVASGVYFARLRVNNEPARVEKLVLVK